MLEDMRARFVSLLFLVSAGFGQPFQAARETGQGRVITLTGDPSEMGLLATFGKRSFPVFSKKTLLPVAVDQPPGDYEIVIKTSGGTVLQKLPLTVAKTPFRTQNIRATKQMKAIEPAPGEIEKMRALSAMVTSARFFESRFVPPTAECQNSPFGVQRLHNGKPTGAYHRGADLRSPSGTPVKAMASGKVIIATMEFRLNGGTIGLDHGQGLTSHYIHLSKVAVEEGQMVKQGDVVGFVGTTGFSTGAHLHWGTVLHNTPVDPNEFIKLTPCAVKTAPAKKKAKTK